FFILFAVIAAVLLGVLGNAIPEDVRQNVIDVVLSPLSNCFLGLLNTFAGLMIFLTICSGILGMGDSATLGRTGKSVIIRFVGILFSISAVSAAAVLPFVHLNHSSVGQEQMSVFGQISQMFFDILPTNIVDPFRSGNTFHIIVIASFVGCALLAIGERGTRLRTLIGESAQLFQQIVSSVCTLVPLFVFSMLLQLIWSGQARVLVSVLKPIVMIAVMIVILAVIVWIASSLRLKCPPVPLMKKVLPAFFVAFTSASSVSAFQIGMETCEKKLGVDKHLASFIYPLGAVIYMPSSVIYFTVLVCTFAETYQIAVGIPWLILAVVISTLITIAMPPIPGADILCYTVLFSALGIPTEAIILATAAGILLDYLDTGTNVMLMICRIACDAKRLGKLDQRILLDA
ncbi:MAG: cation:dicarboxylase symporter family transporter, partial [Atopobiaceae bacterium]|nr:cation:dicarboxylase symporter family transporter [Atopobiaceae bacterium]